MFDGYLSSSTKDMTHQETKREFLTNKVNKQRFVKMLGEALEKRSCRSCYASTDADLFIVQKGIESAANTDTILVGDDTDLFVLLCYQIHVAYISNQ